MSLQELLEHAHLEALGLLDEREQAAFEAALGAAPTAVREQVIREQARVAPMEHLLPAVEAPAHLRSRVLTAVSAAILAEQSGRTDLVAARRVHRGWRAATIGLITAVVILSGAFVQVYTANTRMNSAFEDDAAATAFLQTFGRKYMNDVLYNTETQRVLLTSTDKSFTAKATVWVSPQWDSSRMFCQLPALGANESYRVVTLDDNNAVVNTVHEMPGDGQSEVCVFDKLASGSRIAIVSAIIGQQPLQGAHLLMVGTV